MRAGFRQTSCGSRAITVLAVLDGDFVVVWHGQGSSGTDTSDYSIHGQRYDVSGVTVGDEFQVNTYTTNRQFSPHVAGETGE